MRVSEEHVTHPDAAFRYLRLELQGFGGARHRHGQAELTWVERGHGVRFVGDSTEPFADGDLGLLGPRVPHLWTGRAGAGEATFLAHVVQFPTALLSSPLLPELHAAQALLDRAGRGLRVQGQAHAPVVQALRAMAGADALQRLALLVQALRALVLHARSLRPLSAAVSRGGGGGGVGPDAGRAAAGRIDRVIDWIHQHLAAELFMADAARVAHVSPAAFSRFFSRETGKTWTAYVNDVRCSEAAVHLRQGRRPVAEVAHDCGYRTLSHFNREFRARFGAAPSDYRRR
jgi:AraC-like DNA-binding protein